MREQVLFIGFLALTTLNAFAAGNNDAFGSEDIVGKIRVTKTYEIVRTDIGVTNMIGRALSKKDIALSHGIVAYGKNGSAAVAAFEGTRIVCFGHGVSAEEVATDSSSLKEFIKKCL